jgi:hypothetical protein
MLSASNAELAMFHKCTWPAQGFVTDWAPPQSLWCMQRSSENRCLDSTSIYLNWS